MIDNPLFGREVLRVEARGDGPHGVEIQRAIDAVAGRGGGTVVLAAGRYRLTDSVRLRSDVRLVGEGDREAVLGRDAELAASELLCDVDVGQFVFTPADASRFRPGMGIIFHDRNSGWSHHIDPLTITEVRDGQVYLGEMNIADRLAEHHAVAVNYFPLLLGRFADRVCVENLTLDGEVESAPVVQTLRTAGLYLYRSRMADLRNLAIRNVRGDGICFGKASLHTTVERCETDHNSNYGIHPGSHSARCAVRHCHIHHNGSDGLYICWGISHSTFEDNDIHDNGRRDWRSGISIGHKDTDNVLARNRVYHNAKFGICFRRKTAANGAHRNVVRDNVIENNGHDPIDIPARLREAVDPAELVSCGVYVNGVTDGLVFERNIIRETRPAPENRQLHAFIFEDDVTRVTLRDNQMQGHRGEAILDRGGALAEAAQAVA